jgi:nucleotide-binding universal stress UspA family protein
MSTNGRSDATRPVLIAFDGSIASRQAVAEVAELIPERACVILTVSNPNDRDVLEFESDEAVAKLQDLNATDLEEARRLSEEGVALAVAAGSKAEPSSLQVHGPAWAAILDVARTIHAALIAVGAHNRHPIIDDVLGSQTLEVLKRADVPVLVVSAQRTLSGPKAPAS